MRGVCVCVWCHPGLTVQPSTPASAPQQRSDRGAERIGVLQIQLFSQQCHQNWNKQESFLLLLPLWVILYTTKWWKCGFTAVIFSCLLKLPGALWEVYSGHSEQSETQAPCTHLGDSHLSPFVYKLDYIVSLSFVWCYEEVLGERENLSSILLAHEAAEQVLEQPDRS